MCANPVGQEQGETSAVGSSGDKNKPFKPSTSNSDQYIIHSESLKSIAEINHWRCSGFPLYGQVNKKKQVQIYIFVIKILFYVSNISSGILSLIQY